jgi:hypothetical protein
MVSPIFLSSGGFGRGTCTCDKAAILPLPAALVFARVANQSFPDGWRPAKTARIIDSSKDGGAPL